MKIAFVSNLFPDTSEPFRGLDNSVLLQHLASLPSPPSDGRGGENRSACEIRVISPRPVLPFSPDSAGSRAPRPADEQFKPIYPKALYVPKIGSSVNHLLFARAIRTPLQTLRETFPFDAILCSWTYPDGCAVARVARELGVPFVLIAQGSDVHVYLQMASRRKLICAAANQSSATITRSKKLTELLREAGVAKEKLHPIYNGVDLETFRPGNRDASRKELGLPLDAKIILFVGNFFEIKNPLLLVDAHAELCRRDPDGKIHLVMLGDGPLCDAAWSRANASGCANAIHLLGRKPPAEVARYMQAADLLCISSDNEGVPNVVLEAFACGLPVVSTRVGGIPEVLTENFLGRLVEKRNLPALVTALKQTLATKAESDKIRNHAVQFSWERTAAAYLALLRNAARRTETQ